MRAIVSLMKFFVGASFLFYTVMLAFFIGASLIGLGTTNFAGLGGAGILLAIAGFVLLVLFTGMVALLISVHDRFCDIVAIMKRRNELLEGPPSRVSATSRGDVPTVEKSDPAEHFLG